MLLVRPAYFLVAPSILLDSFGESDLVEPTPVFSVLCQILSALRFFRAWVGAAGAGWAQ